MTTKWTGRVWRMTLLAASAAGLGLLLAGCQLPPRIAVTSTADAPDVAPGDGACRTVANECTLRAAIQEANARPGVVVIELAPGATYALTVDGRGEDLSATGDLDITDPVQIAGAGAIIDGRGLDRVFDIRPDVASVSIGNLTVEGGAPDEDGGGILNAGSLSLLAVTVRDNVGVNGGGLANFGELGLMLVTITNNSANQAGGALLSSGTLSMTTSTASENSSVGEAAIYFDGGQARLDSSTVTNNIGGLAIDSDDVTLTNTIVADQLTGPNCGLGRPFSGDHNLVSDGSCGLHQPSDIQDVSAQLDALADNGGLTSTHQPRLGSPAIDAIPIGVNGCGTALPIDQRLSTRPLDGDGDGIAACDIGAVERPAVDPVVVDTANDTLDTDPGDGACRDPNGECSLRAAIQEANARPTHQRITIGAGVNPTLTRAGRYEDGTRTGDLDVVCTCVIDGQGTTVDANALDRVFDVQPSASLSIRGLTVTGGQVDEWDDGGAFYNRGTLSLTATTVRDNQAGSAGAVMNLGTLTTVDTTFFGNQGYVGGAIYSLGSNLTMLNSTVSGNVGDLGAVYIEGGTAGLDFTTVTANVGPGVAVDTYGLSMRNSIVADQIGGSDCLGTLAVSFGHNVTSDSSCALGGLADQQNASSLLGPLADNGGSTRTHLPALGSATVDQIRAGDGGCASVVTGDQRGAPRPTDGDGNGSAACDVGAVERPTLP